MTNLNRQMARGALWMSLLRICVRGIGLLSTVILARLLLPEDFGLIAMATSVIAFLELATAFNFDIPLIQKRNTSRNDFDSVWTLNIIFFSGLTALLLLIATPAASFYQESRLEDIIYVLAIGFFVRGFENVGVINFRKELNFQKDFTLMLAKKLVGFLVTIPLAFAFRSYWALIAGIVIGNIFGVAFTYYLHPFRPRLSLQSSAELFSFSKWLILNNVVNFLRTRSPDFIVGRISGTTSLGLFTVAFELATMPTTDLVAPINRAVFPGYSKLSDNIGKLRQSYLDVIAIVALIALPAGFGLAAVAGPLINVILGDKWADAAPIVEIVAIYGGIFALQTNSGSVFYALGKPHLITLTGSINIVVLLGLAIALALQYGPVGVAYAYLGSTVLLSPLTFYFICRELRLSTGALLGAIAYPVVFSSLMIIAIRVFDGHLAARYDLGSFSQLILLMIVGVAVYSLLTIVGWLLKGRPENAEWRLANLIVQRVRRKS